MPRLRSKILAKTAYNLRRLFERHQPWSALVLCVVLIGLLRIGSVYYTNQSYKMTAAEKQLLSSSSVDASKVTYKKGLLSYNRSSEKKNGSQQITVATATDSTSKAGYKVTLASNTSGGIEFSDTTSELPFKLIPLTHSGSGRYIDGRMVYPIKGGKGIYTLRRNGIKEDIILTKAPGNTFTYKWKLELGDKLEAKMLPNGSVGIYSADPMLNSSSLQISDAKSQALIDNARKNGKKTLLQYLIPRPYFKDGQGKLSAGGVSFSLKDNLLTLTATHLKDKKYPLSIDPTVVTTTTADFATGYDDGNIDYSTADEIDRAGIGTGLVGTWHYTHNSADDSTTFSAGFNTARESFASVAYNGYLYVLGGGGANSGDCTTLANYCNGVQYAAINADGTIGIWNYTHSSTNDGATFVSGFTQPRQALTAVAYHGYLYVIGGQANTGADCPTGGICGGVQYAPINSDGTVGDWHYTHNSTDDSTTFVDGFITPRYDHASVTYNGYLYVIGGYGPNAMDCNAGSSYCNGVQYAPINANGTIGVWHFTHNSTDDGTSFVAGFTQARRLQSSVAYNGYLYVIGGESGSTANDCSATAYCNGVQFAPINANGTIGVWHYTSNGADNGTTFSSGFLTPRTGSTATIYNGYLYLMGGFASATANDCTGGGSNFCSGTQYAPVYANGIIGSWNYTAGNSSCSTWVAPCTTGYLARQNLASIVYNGYLYVLGGYNSVSSTDCGFALCRSVQFVPITTLRATTGTAGAWNYTSNSANNGSTFSAGFTQSRYGHASVAYNGYLYITGGVSGTSANDCTNSVLNYCNGVQFAPINADGTIGAWHYTHNSTDDGTTFVAGFTQSRNTQASVAYNGYLYIIGGTSGTTANDCTGTSSRCSGVQFAPINSNGTIGTWNYTGGGSSCATWVSPCSTSFADGRYGLTSVAYNGYLYIIGGSGTNGSYDCDGGGDCNGVQFAPINANGTIGTWHFTHNSTDDGTTFVAGFTQPRTAHTSAIYNGYLYVIGGISDTSGNDCTTSGNNCNGVQYAAINANGTIGTWHYTDSSADRGTTFSAGFKTARYYHTSAVYNGYLYVMGGFNGSLGSDCSTYCNGVQYAHINPNGTIGTWNFTHNSANDGGTFSAGFNTARSQHTSVMYNGYLYVIGGRNNTTANDCSNYCNGVQYASISAGTSPSFGTDGTWNFTHNSTNDSSSFVAGFTQVRNYHTSVAYNGYLYVIGGASDSSGNDCTTGTGTFYCNGVQYAPINANGTIGAWHFTSSGVDNGTTFSAGFTQPRSDHTSVAYNGYLYVIGGVTSTSGNDCTTGISTIYCNGVQFAAINANGTIGAWHYTDSSVDRGAGATFSAGFTQPRSDHTSIAYNGYLYVMGGKAGSAANDCTASSSVCSGVQFAAINANGTIGAWHYTDSSVDRGAGATFSAGFTQPRYSHSSNAYNGYLYILGGKSSSSAADCTSGTGSFYCNGVQFAPINSNGTIGAWHYTSGGTDNGTTFSAGFTQPRYQHASVAYNGYLYILGGGSNAGGNDCGSSAPILCNGVQFAPISSNGTIGAWHYTSGGTDNNTTYSSGFYNARSSPSVTVFNGYVYISGGLGYASSNDCDASSYCSGVQFTSLNSPDQAATYDKLVDIGGVGKITALSFSGRAVCGMRINYQLGDSTGAFGSVNTIAFGLPGTTYSLSGTNTRYIWVQFKLDDSICGTTSQITDFTVTYNVAPAGPTLSAPSAGATGVSAVPQFQLRTTDQDNDYLRYKIDVCSTSNCSSIVRTVDQTSSQTGWSGQDQQTNTAYTGNSVITSSTTASHTYQIPPLTKNTQYWWRAYAIDPGGSNAWSPASSIQTFTTGDDAPSAPTLLYPVSASSGNSVLTTFQLRSTENNSDYVEYWIDICSTNNCSVIVRSICQYSAGTGVPGTCTASQTGWAAQDQQSGTAYTGNPLITLSQLAVHNYQSPYLTMNTQYWWRAYAIDPGGSNTWSAASAISTFTTAPTETHIQGNVKFQGNVKL